LALRVSQVSGLREYGMPKRSSVVAALLRITDFEDQLHARTIPASHEHWHLPRPQLLIHRVQHSIEKRYRLVGREPARQLALRFGSRLHPIGLHQAAKKKTDGVYISVKKGGTMIEYEDEDPEIRRRFDENLRRVGIPTKMI